MLQTHILQRIDALCGLLNFAADDLWDQLGGEAGQSDGGGFTLDNLDHLLADGADLGGTGVGGFLDLVGSSLGEGDGEEAQQVVVGRLHGDVGLDERLPLADQRPQFVGGEVEPVEVGQAVLALHFVHPQFHLAERVVLVLLQVRQRHLENPPLQRVVGVLQTRRAVH